MYLRPSKLFFNTPVLMLPDRAHSGSKGQAGISEADALMREREILGFLEQSPCRSVRLGQNYRIMLL